MPTMTVVEGPQGLTGWQSTLDALPDRHPAVIGRWLLRAGMVVALTAMPLSLVLMHIGLGMAGAGFLLSRPPIHRLPGFWLAAAFAAWLPLSIWATRNAIGTLGPAYIWLALYLGMVAFAHTATRRLAVHLLLITATAAALLGWVQFVVGMGESKPFHVSASGPRLREGKGFLPTHLHHGLAMAMATLALWYAFSNDQADRWKRWLGGSVALSGLVCAASRAALLGLLAGFGLGEARHGLRRSLAVGGTILALAALGAAAMLITNPDRVSRLARFEDGRWPIWRTSAAIATERPWFGAGGTKPFRDRYRELYPLHSHGVPDEFAARDPLGRNTAPHAHNSLLALAAEHGVPAAGLYLAWIVWLVAAAWRDRARLRTGATLAIAGITTALVGGLFENYAGNSTTSYALYLTLAVAWNLGGTSQPPAPPAQAVVAADATEQ